MSHFYEEVRLIGGPYDGRKLVSRVDDLDGFPTITRDRSPFEVLLDDETDEALMKPGHSYAFDRVEGSICYLRYLSDQGA